MNTEAKRETGLSKDDLRVDATYRAKRPRHYGDGIYNDRTIIWRGETTVQYDGPAVKFGQSYPRVSIKKFLRWASHEITEAHDDD